MITGFTQIQYNIHIILYSVVSWEETQSCASSSVCPSCPGGSIDFTGEIHVFPYIFSSDMPEDTPAVESLSIGDQLVTPWEVQGATVDGKLQAIDYSKLIEQFGTRPIDDAMLQRMSKLTGATPHRFLRRGLFFSHR